ncbi:L,D-transpeptidase [Niabella ginsengisoli]|uniref:L,D-transpeptidase n=1 Tax=Niabella ginsengisoli TaxID=522298 RepID=A0ABS9SHN7_9BACT|nr:L,D-transpeptidase [Niabella ginsengisoli]MCH5597892.1 L,D-transpeptidase [Niabella ginsengisoli]
MSHLKILFPHNISASCNTMNVKHLIPYIPILLISIIFSCKNNEKKSIPDAIDSTMKTVVEKIAPPQKENLKPSISYEWMKKKEWQSKKDSFEGAKHLDILNAINRVDATHLKRLDSILVPNDFSLPLKDYMPFPDYVEVLKDVNKIILFSYPTQAFAAYENGKLILTGPTNMGRKNKKTPTGLFFTNWKARKTISTVDDEWILKWNFNIHNKWGVGFHEYALPGYPASHSCLRLLATDAQFLYGWANQWILKNDYERLAYGTPVIVFGAYPFGEPRPWFKLAEDSKALTIPMDSLNNYVEPHLQEIMEKQTQRQEVETQNAP